MWWGAEKLKAVSPVAWTHVNFSGRYTFREEPAVVPIDGFVETLYDNLSGRNRQFTCQTTTKQGAHLLLQVRAQVLNEDLRATFERWYPTMGRTNVPQQKAA